MKSRLKYLLPIVVAIIVISLIVFFQYRSVPAIIAEAAYLMKFHAKIPIETIVNERVYVDIESLDSQVEGKKPTELLDIIESLLKSATILGVLHPNVNYYLGNVHLRYLAIQKSRGIALDEKRVSDAINSFKAARSTQGVAYYINRSLWSIYVDTKQCDKALQMISKIYAIGDESFTRLAVLKAVTYLNCENITKAIECGIELVKQKARSDSMVGHIILAIAYSRTGKCKKASKHWAQAIKSADGKRDVIILEEIKRSNNGCS